MDPGIAERVREANEKPAGNGRTRARKETQAEKIRDEARPKRAADHSKGGHAGGINFRF